MLWLVISSLVMGVSHVPTGASLAAILIVCGLIRGAPALEENTDLQIANNATHQRACLQIQLHTPPYEAMTVAVPVSHLCFT